MKLSNWKIFSRFLPYPWNIHVRGIFFAFAFLFFHLLFNESNGLQMGCMDGLIVFFDYEVIYWLSKPVFRLPKSTNSKDFTVAILWRVVTFYIIIIVVGVIVAGSVITFFNFESQSYRQLDVAFLRFVDDGLSPIFNSLLIASAVVTIIFFFFLWQDALKSMYKMREEVFVYQSETLKNQLNPHFLFNSLNTLSSLITVDPGRAELFTQKLSEIYRYVLENREVQQVRLKTELDFVRDFYFLQKIRDEEKIELSFSLENEEAYDTLPISIQLLVENAFKHNIATKDQPLHISIVQKGSWIEVINDFRPKTKISTSTGVGINNLKERIKMCTGKELQISQTDIEYRVAVPLLPISVISNSKSPSL